ncbi:RsmB/NOP family class I SAM-dependent RNA methyltransferase [Desulfitobacterium metallireducens]|uniref:SAM-dependent methyltransferase n=1 Tax=Desulfitobacterium metallireducens DSM 15288 TaxID=871968 RepID=W0EAS6_9FIRM|nr:RsmF rRNA methyltransferase first C-terminal domain-containing protein [Desulfitobacterium metallireducens]AHF07975.1 SAM-dependent methyltransferase [Desulfitobacterium metallireducens DSM 15288]
MLSSKLPQLFNERMAQDLKDEFSAFIASYDSPRLNGLRVNTLKLSAEAFLKRWPFELEPISWAKDGFYYHYTTQPGQHPYHAAGVYYLQEPSAMAVLHYLDPQPGERVLDLAAAPGGKSTGIAARLNRKGLLWSNEIHPTRARILAQNMDRWGAPNVIVSNENPDHLANHFRGFFDKVLLDAPCSGEGMFRKDPEVMEEWSLEHVQSCAHRQALIIESAAALVRPGGRLVYSTCTFAPQENEEVILRFLESHPEFSPLSLPDPAPDFVHPSTLPEGVRLYPHRIRGEGHFIVALLKAEKMSDSSSPSVSTAKKAKKQKRLAASANASYRSPQNSLNPELDGFIKETLSSSSLNPDLLGAQRFSSENILAFGDHLYSVPEPHLDFQGLSILRPGLYLGEKKPGRFQPGQSLALALTPDSVSSYLALSREDPLLERYLHGEAIPNEGPNGWVLVGVEEFPLGWGKRVQGLLKNHYPKELRNR